MVDTTPTSSTAEDKKLPVPEEVSVEAGEIINASGHRDQLQRQYGILSICGMALTVDNAWVAIGTSMNVAIC
jgi:choline transport protein